MACDRITRVLACVPTFFVAPALAAAQSTKLNGPLAGPTSRVSEYAVDPSGTFVLYVADQDRAGVFELYRVPLDLSAAPARLSAPMSSVGRSQRWHAAGVASVTPFGDVASFAGRPSFLIAPTGRVVYRADANVDGRFELFSVPLDGSQPPVALCPPMTGGGEVVLFSLTPDGSRVVYVADQDVDEVRELYVVPTDGSAPAHRVHTPIVQGSVFHCYVDPTGAAVLYDIGRYVGQTLVSELFSAPLDASAAPALLGTYSATDLSSGIESVAFSPDGAWAAFTVNHVNENFESHADLYLVPVDASQSARSLMTYAGASLFTPDGGRVVFAHGFPYGPPPPNSLFSATLTGSPVALDTAAPRYLGPSRHFDPSGTTLYFGEESGIYRVPVDGSAAPTLLSSPLAPGTSVNATELSPDGQGIVFSTSTLSPTPNLWSVPTSGGPTTLLDTGPASPWSSLIHDVRIAPDSRRVVYEVWTGPLISQYALFLTRIDGSRPPHRLDGPMAPGGTVVRWSLLGEDRVLYLAAQETSGVVELFESPLEWPSWKSGARPAGPLVPH